MQLGLLLWQLRTSQVTDSRDRLFGILGLIRHDRSDPLLAIDYQKSVPEVFRDLSMYLIQHGFLADVLRAVTYKIEGLPHWAALWAAPVDLENEAENPPSRISFGLGRFMAVSRSRGSEGAHARFSEGGRKLTVRGALMDDIALVSKSHDCSGDEGLSVDEKLKAIRARLLSSEDEMECNFVSYRLYTEREERLKIWRDAIPHETEEDSWLGEHYDRLLGRAVPSDGEDRRRTPPAMDSAIVMRLVTELKTMFGDEFECRRPFVTANGRIGSTGSSCRVMVGDVLCLLVGCAMPFLLRPVEGSQGLFRFVTCCFVPGLMNFDLFGAAAYCGFDVEDIGMV